MGMYEYLYQLIHFNIICILFIRSGGPLSVTVTLGFPRWQSRYVVCTGGITPDAFQTTPFTLQGKIRPLSHFMPLAAL